MKNCGLRHTEERDGFTIKVYTTPELGWPDWDISEEDRKQFLAAIESGRLEWFIIKVIVEKNCKGLASDYLTNCCSRSVEKFIKSNDWYSRMVATVIDKAKENLSKSL